MDEIIVKSDYELGMESAWKLFGENDLNGAKVLVLELIEKYPQKTNNHFLLGHIYLDEEQLKLAITYFKIALENDINEELTGYIYYWIGIVYGMGGPFSSVENSIYDKNLKDKYLNLSRENGKYPIELLFELRSNFRGQDLIQLWEDGTAKFPQKTDFYVLLANEYEKCGLFNKQWTILSKAIELNLTSATLFYNIGKFKYFKNELESAIYYFEKVLEQENVNNYSFGVCYLIGKAYLSLNRVDKAEIFFHRAYNDCVEHNDRLFGLFGLLELYIQSNNTSLIVEIITNLEISDQLFDEYGRSSGGPLFLDGHYPDTIRIDNWDELYKSISTLRIQKDNSFYNSKLNLIKAFLANIEGKYYEAHRAILISRKYHDGISYDILLRIHSDILGNLIQYKCNTESSVKKTLAIVVADLQNFHNLSSLIISYFNEFVESLFEYKEYQGLIDFANFYSQTVLKEQDVVFKLAYSYAEVKNNQMAKEYYEFELQGTPRSTAVLNNLANLYKVEGDLKRALELYEEGIEIDPNDEILNENLKRARNLYQQEEDKFTKQKVLSDYHAKVVQSLIYENDYILEKLLKFIEKAKLENGFNKWKVPIAKYKFHVLPGVDQQRGELLREQWLSKEYIVDTGERDNRSVIIYEINPLLEAEITKINKKRIPEKWLTGFVNIKIGALDDIGYFELLDRIAKINEKFQPIIERDFNELVNNYLMGHEKATIVLSGSLVELLLIYYCEKNEMMTITIENPTAGQKKKKLYECVLIDLIEFVEQTKPFGSDFYHLSNLSRIYRNFIHPGKELKGSLDKSKAEICFVSTREILNRII